MCEICHEQLEQFWEEDEEDWHFKDTIRSSDGMLYHTYCFVDSKEVFKLTNDALSGFCSVYSHMKCRHLLKTKTNQQLFKNLTKCTIKILILFIILVL
jgi:hypothetical protein